MNPSQCICLLLPRLNIEIAVPIDDDTGASDGEDSINDDVPSKDDSDSGFEGDDMPSDEQEEELLDYGFEGSFPRATESTNNHSDDLQSD